MEEGVFSVAHAIAVLGAGLGLLGGCVGIGIIGGKALDALARQPEESKSIRTNMLLMAALIEGLAFFGAIIALIVIFMGGGDKGSSGGAPSKNGAGIVEQVSSE
jgi:F-type H+-transporting ATPase subunit c